MDRRLYRSRRNRVFLGVCGGLGEYFHVDPVVIRVIAVLLLIPGFFPAIIAYFILAIIIPLEGSTADTPKGTFQENVSDIKNTAAGLGEEIRSTFENRETRTEANSGAHPTTPPRPRSGTNRSLYILGLIIIAIGIFFLLTNIFSWFGRFIWPTLLIIAGIIIVILVARRK